MTDSLAVARLWAEHPFFDEATRAQARALLAEEQASEREECFGASLEFGTGGLRGLMGVGTNRMNQYTVMQATEGLARYMEQHPDPKAQGVVIGYDSRNQSREFAQTAASVIAAHGLPVYLFREIAPTPLVSCELLRRKAQSAIILTASHNPPEYNGYKVYWKNGGQIVPPEDREITQEVRGVTDLSVIPSRDLTEAEAAGVLHWIGPEADEFYFEEVRQLSVGNRSDNRDLGVLFTPLHGTGGRLVPELLRRQGFEQAHTVETQMVPDGNFTSVKSPNPEDPHAFELALAQADMDDRVILCNDPDADRLGVMVRDSTQNWVRLNGNQIGVLLLDFTLSQLHRSHRMPAQPVFITTNVTTPLARSIAEEHGVQVLETLTGFKWIRALAEQLEREGQGDFVFGMEESHGYLRGGHSGDKDGVWAALAFAEMTAVLVTRGMTPVDHLQQLQVRHGYHLDEQRTRTLPGLEGKRQIAELIQNFREHPPEQLGGLQTLKVEDLREDTIRDLNSGEVSSGPGLPPSDVLTLHLEHGTRVIVRPSGTEPKIKFYFNLKDSNPEALAPRFAALLQDLKL